MTRKNLENHASIVLIAVPHKIQQRYFPPDDEKIAVEDHDYVGKDKVCGFCEAPNSALAKFCTECAGPMDGTKDVQLVNEDADRKHQM